MAAEPKLTDRRSKALVKRLKNALQGEWAGRHLQGKLPKAAAELLQKGSLTMPADNGREFIYKFRSKEAEIEGVAEDLIMDVFVKEDAGERMIGYAHAVLFEDREWDRWVSIRGALEESELVHSPFSPGIFVLDKYKNSYRGIGKTAISLMQQIAQIKKAYRFVLEEVVRDSNRMFASESGFVPYVADGNYLEFILYPPYMKSRGITFHPLGIKKESKPEYHVDMIVEAPDDAVSEDLISRRARGDRYIYILSPEDGSVERVMRFSGFEKEIQALARDIIPKLLHGRVWWFQKQRTLKVSPGLELIKRLDTAA